MLDATDPELIIGKHTEKLEHLKAISQNILNFELFSILIFPNVKKNYLSK